MQTEHQQNDRFAVFRINIAHYFCYQLGIMSRSQLMDPYLPEGESAQDIDSKDDRFAKLVMTLLFRAEDVTPIISCANIILDYNVYRKPRSWYFGPQNHCSQQFTVMQLFISYQILKYTMLPKFTIRVAHQLQVALLNKCQNVLAHLCIFIEIEKSLLQAVKGSRCFKYILYFQKGAWKWTHRLVHHSSMTSFSVYVPLVNLQSLCSSLW